MTATKKWSRVPAIFLALTLTLSSSPITHAEPDRATLRDTQTVEKTPEVLAGLEEALRDPNRFVQLANTALGLSSSSGVPRPNAGSPDSAASVPGRANASRSAGLEEARETIRKAFEKTPADVRDRVIQLFESRIQYFETPERLASFQSRVKKFGQRILAMAHDSRLYATKDPFYQDVLFLMLTRGTIKDLVWEHAQDGRSQIEAAGGRPAAFFNLFGSNNVRKALQEALGSGILKKPQALSDEIEWLTGYPLSAFQQDDHLFDLFADEVVQALRVIFPERKRQFPEGDSRASLIDSILGRLRSDTYGDTQFVLTDRSVEFLKGGNRAGDCTACGSFSAWTAAPWNATFENFEIETYRRGEFFARFVGILGKTNGTLAVWIHAVEFTPLARAEEGTASRSKFADPALQRELLLESLKFIDAFAKRGGATQLYLTGISNSFGFVSVLQGLLRDFSSEHGVSFASQSFRLLNGLHSAHGIREVAEGSSKERSVPIYLQGWRGPARFEKITKEELAEEDKPTLSFAGEQINRDELDRGARLFMQMIRERLEAQRKHLSGLDFEVFQEQLLEALIEGSGPRAGLQRMGEGIGQTVMTFTELFDPGASESVRNDLNKMTRDLLRKGSKVPEKGFEIVEEWTPLIQLLSRDIHRFRRKQGRMPNAYEVQRMLVRNPKYRYRIPGIPDSQELTPLLGLGSAGYEIRRERIEQTIGASGELHILDSFLESMPENGFKSARRLPETQERWRKNFVRNWVGPRYFSKRSFFKRRPSELKRLHNWLDSLVANLIHLQGVQGPGVMAVMDRVDSNLAGFFKSMLREGGGYSEESIRLMTEHPAELIDYYISVSKTEKVAT